MSDQFIYKGHCYLELDTNAQNSKIPQPCTGEMAWEESSPGAGDGNAWPDWIQMVYHNYLEDGVMAGPTRNSLDNNKILFKIMWLPLFGKTYFHLINAATPQSGIVWLSWKEAKVLVDGPDYLVS